MKVHKLMEYKLTDLDWELLDDLYAVLAVSFTHIQIHLLLVQLAAQVPHLVQQIMLAKSMPVLSGAILSFEIFMMQWEKLHVTYPELAPWVNIGLEWAEKYYDRMDDTNVYVIVMCELLLNSLSNLNVN
jgi:hypothetical protein